MLIFFVYARYDPCLQPIKEAALGNIPTIAFCDTDSPMRYIDIGIPANNKGKHSIGCLFWLLARMVLQMRNSIPQGQQLGFDGIYYLKLLGILMLNSIFLIYLLHQNKTMLKGLLLVLFK